MKTIVTIFASLIFSYLGYVSVFDFGEIVINPNIQHFLTTNVSYVRILILFLSMILGILSRALTDELDWTRRTAFKTIIRKASKSQSFMFSLLVSPMIFYVVYNVAGKLPDDIIAFCISFQNDFFWKVIFETMQKQT